MNSETKRSVVDAEHLAELHQQAESELDAVRARMSAIEAQLTELEALKQRARQLETLRQSLAQLLNPQAVFEAEAGPVKSITPAPPPPKSATRAPSAENSPPLPDYTSDAFYPETAFAQADEILTHRQSMNYEIFRAVVLNGGHANTREIRDYLVQNDIKTPNGKGFEGAKLSEISARTAYLVKRGVIRAIAPGHFVSCFGWGQAAAV